MVVRRPAGQPGAAAGRRAAAGGAGRGPRRRPAGRGGGPAAGARQVHPGLCGSPWCARRPSSAPASTPSPPGTSRRRGCSRSGAARPAWQFCHVEDLARAVVAVVEQGLGPVVTVAAEGTLTQERVEQVTGMRRVHLSEGLALGTAQRLHRVGVLPAPAVRPGLRAHPWAVPAATLRAAGWAAGVRQRDLPGGAAGRGPRARTRWRRGGSTARTRPSGAASAAVALVGTAAIMRRRRRKGGGA